MVSQIKRSVAAGVILFWMAAAQAQEATRAIRVANDVDVPVQVYGASSKVILWLPAETGIVNADTKIAAQLAQQGYEVWLADLFAGRFLPVVPSSLAQIPDKDVSELLRQAARGHQQVYLVSSSHGAGLALAGLRRWQRGGGKHFAGAVLLYPNLYAGSPEAGEAPRYLAIAKQTRAPIALIQGNLSPWFWRVDEMKRTLARGGSQVWVKILPGTRDRFYFRDDALPAERELAAQMPALIVESMHQLTPTKKRKTP